MKRSARVLAVTLTAASLLAFSGCSVRAQTAFSVNGTVTTMTQLNDTVNGCATAFGEAPSDLSASAVANAMVMAQISRDIAQQQNTQTSEADLASMIQTGQIQGLTPSMVNDPNCGSLAVGMALQMLLMYQMGTNQFLAAAQSYNVVINPRFGTWNTSNLTLTGSGSLSQPTN